MSRSVQRASSWLDPTPVTAVLGPTNTGKTHYAVERLLGHASGIIGLPLRLLAREIYDRIVALKGPREVALVTGEEKIVPPFPRWFVCTVEAMPLDRDYDFLAVDEIQLVADPERGHVFTDRLLRARGARETVFLGSDTVKALIRRLIPRAEVIERPRLSRLLYTGVKKLHRLPRRSAIVAFSAADVYQLAEAVRARAGGSAVVLGALSPRTRNAQVAMYQAGEVDYLVATDAIGMGLNMDIDHVAFAGLHKFDGLDIRRLSPAEMGQIAGRAGRHLRNGSFGTTADIPELEPELIDRIENHRFEPVTRARWRSGDLDFSGVKALLTSLDQAPPHDALQRARDAEDHLTLKALAQDDQILAAAGDPGRVRLLWSACQIPDFRRSLHDQHVRLVRQIFLKLCEGPLPQIWVSRQLDGLDRYDGDIDALSTRIAHIRTWTYIAYRLDWLAEAAATQARARAIEDRLSDALHERLTQRFVDRRAAALSRRLDQPERLEASIATDGEVSVADQVIGRIVGLRFEPLADAARQRALRVAANRVVAEAVAGRARALTQAGDDALDLTASGQIRWNDIPVAELTTGERALSPTLKLLCGAELGVAERAAASRRLLSYVQARIARTLGQLGRVAAADLSGAARGLAYQLVEALGALPRAAITDLLAGLSGADRHELRRLGVKFGQVHVFLPSLLKPAAAAMAGMLWAVHRGVPVIPPPKPGLTSLTITASLPDGWWRSVGFAPCGGRAVRLDMLERIADLVRPLAAAGPFAAPAELVSLLGCALSDIDPVLLALGFRRGEDSQFVKRGPKRRRQVPAAAPAPAPDPSSPFAALHRLRA